MPIDFRDVLTFLKKVSNSFREVGSPPKYIASVEGAKFVVLPIPNGTYSLDRVTIDIETVAISNLKGVLTGIWDIVGTAESKSPSQYFDHVLDLIRKGETKVTIGTAVVTMFQVIGDSACVLTIVTL